MAPMILDPVDHGSWSAFTPSLGRTLGDLDVASEAGPGSVLTLALPVPEDDVPFVVRRSLWDVVR